MNKKQLSHELSMFGKFISEQKSRMGSDLFASKKRYQQTLSEDLDQFKSEFDTFHDELFGRFYEDSQELESPVQWSKDIHDMLDSLQEFQSLKNSVHNDPELSALSSAFVAKQFEDNIIDILKAKKEQADRNKEENQNDNGNREENPANVDMNSLSKDIKDQLESSMMKKAMDIQPTIEKISDIKDGLQQIGMGSKDTPNPTREEFIKLAFNDVSINNIMKLMGRLKREMRNVPAIVPQKPKIKSFDLTYGRLPDEIKRERFLACNDDTWDMYCYRAATRKQFVRKKKHDTDNTGSGPIVMCLDNSGSMSGNMQLAKSLTIALLAIAKKNKRDFFLCTFNRSISGEYQVLKKDKEHHYAQTIKDITKIGALGGTNFNYPISWAIKKCNTNHKADIIFLTDGISSLSSSYKKEMIDLNKKLGTRLFTMYVMTDSNPDLNEISQGTIAINDLKSEQSLSKIASILKTVNKK